MIRALAVSAGLLLIGSGSVRAAETWDCEYSDFQKSSKRESWFHVEGGQLVEASGDAIVKYELLEDSDATVVAAKGGHYASDPHVMGLLLMIDKGTGKFLMTTASLGAVNGQQDGKCRLASP